MAAKNTLLIVDDQTLFREGLKTIISRNPAYEVVGETGRGETAIQMAKSLRPDTSISMFLHSFYGNDIAEPCSRIPSLDCFGCDGRPWGPAEAPLIDHDAKVLLGGHAARFLGLARGAGKGGLLLIENHDVAVAGYDIMDQRLPEVLALGAEHLIYYYYPRNLVDPERVMATMAKHLRPAYR